MDILESTSESDVIIENQRGFMLLGYPLFSPKLLLRRLDPSNFQIMNREKGTLFNVRDNRRSIRDIFPLDCEDQCGKWFVDMRIGDVDDQGWAYSWNFSHGRWRDGKGFVRRRIWVRHNLEQVYSMDVKQTKNYQLHSMEKEQDQHLPLLALLQKQLLDRHRFEILDECDKSAFQDEELCKNIEHCFQYTSSKHKFREWLKHK
ncbi:hypothetical protein ZYGM_004581 [Zygosaccharomyces mellis]|uniref:Peroxin/Ferlin domain-containing protein n=1 Tax=Zygosaccharomyces mellis TaxID=42258 RepID=A0A4C2E6R1_9SACH|nr:hypothetical protein ZYGM_004581 [Zygosaccharomyces mellis]